MARRAYRGRMRSIAAYRVGVPSWDSSGPAWGTVFRGLSIERSPLWSFASETITAALVLHFRFGRVRSYVNSEVSGKGFKDY